MNVPIVVGAWVLVSFGLMVYLEFRDRRQKPFNYDTRISKALLVAEQYLESKCSCTGEFPRCEPCAVRRHMLDVVDGSDVRPTADIVAGALELPE